MLKLVLNANARHSHAKGRKDCAAFGANVSRRLGCVWHLIGHDCTPTPRAFMNVWKQTHRGRSLDSDSIKYVQAALRAAS